MDQANENHFGSFVTFFEHALLIIGDSEFMAIHEDWDPRSEHVHLDHDSLYVAVQHLVDGPVSVSVYYGDPPSGVIEGFVRVFDGTIVTESGILRIFDSDERAALVLRCQRGSSNVTVFVDELNWSTKVIVGVEA